MQALGFGRGHAFLTPVTCGACAATTCWGGALRDELGQGGVPEGGGAGPSQGGGWRGVVVGAEDDARRALARRVSKAAAARTKVTMLRTVGYVLRNRDVGLRHRPRRARPDARLARSQLQHDVTAVGTVFTRAAGAIKGEGVLAAALRPGDGLRADGPRRRAAVHALRRPIWLLHLTWFVGCAPPLDTGCQIMTRKVHGIFAGSGSGQHGVLRDVGVVPPRIITNDLFVHRNPALARRRCDRRTRRRPRSEPAATRQDRSDGKKVSGP